MELILFLLGLGGGAWGGWRIGRWLLNKKMVDENTYLRQYVEELKQTNKYWQEQASYNKQVHNTTISNHNTNLSQSLETIIHFLQTQNKENMKEGEKEKVESIIRTIKGTL